MAETVNAEFGGKSKYEVAYVMADRILFSFENKKTVTREEYLKTVYDCVRAVTGITPG